MDSGFANEKDESCEQSELQEDAEDGVRSRIGGTGSGLVIQHVITVSLVS
jgi:hypothetical protein